MTKGLIEEPLTHSVIGAFYEVYRELGFGFLEHVYVVALERELRARGHRVGLQVSVPVRYKDEVLGIQRLDMLVDGKLVVEVKSTLELHTVWERQLINYLKGTTLELGLLLHFGPEPKFIRKVFRNDL
jgi:GxxExxY protein